MTKTNPLKFSLFYIRLATLKIFRLFFSPVKGGKNTVINRAFYDAQINPYTICTSREIYITSSHDKTIGRNLFLTGEFDYEKLEKALQIIEKYGPPPKHLIDVGANIGSICIPAIKRNIFSSATAIEPHPHNLRLLRANIAINDLTSKIDVLPFAASSQPGERLFLEETIENSGGHSIQETGKVETLSITIDELNIDIENSILWMDVEGYEAHVLCGAKKLLELKRPIVAEFNRAFLTRSGGIEKLHELLNDRDIYDLSKKTSSKIPLSSLLNDDATHTETDILVI